MPVCPRDAPAEPPVQLVALALAALIGLSLGLLGGGGSILTVPVFVYVLGMEPKLAIAMSLPVVGGASLLGALGHRASGNVNLRLAGAFGAVAMIGAYAGARAAALVRGPVQLTLLGVVMLAAAVAMFRSGRREAIAGAAEPAARPVRTPLLLIVALGVGALTGLVGIGGGFLVVPALVLLGGVRMKEAIGTSLVVIAMNAAAAFTGYLGHVRLPWGFLLVFMAIASVGILAGTWLVRFVSAPALKQAFAAFLVLIGAFILYRNRDVFPGGRPPEAAVTGARTSFSTPTSR